jgi:hypothetical protein
MLVRIALSLSCLFLASCTSAARKDAPLRAQEEPTYGVGEAVFPTGSIAYEGTECFATIGDTLWITAPRHAELSLSKCIDIDGTVLLPELGALQVAGYTRSELEALLARKYSPYYPQLDIKVEIASTGRAGLLAVEFDLLQRLRGFLGQLRAWFDEWIGPPPILIAGNGSR